MTPSACTYDNVTVFRIAELETRAQALQKEKEQLRKMLLDLVLAHFKGDSLKKYQLLKKAWIYLGKP